MALKIVRETDPIEVTRLTLCIYAAPGIGKTSIGFTASRPILLDFDSGAYRSAFRKDSVRVDTWADVDSMTAADLADYDTVIVDTAGRALDTLSAHIINDNPKMKGYGGALSLQGYGALKTAFVAWQRRLYGFGKDVVLLAHMDEQKKGDDIIERLDVQGGSKGEIYKVADAMGRLAIVNKQRFLNFNPTDTAFGKNPGALPVLQVPDFSADPQFLARVIADIKAALNKMSEAQKAAASELADWSAKFEEAATAEAFNALMPETVNASEAVRDNVKRLLLKVAQSKGIEFDKQAKLFKTKEAA